MMDEKMIPLERIYQSILVIRGKKVMLDADLAQFYGVKTKRLNEQVRRNRDRFPEDFMFQLTEAEKQQVVANCDHLSSLKFSKVNPLAFTEYGAIMLAAVLNTDIAIKASVLIVRAYIALRHFILKDKELEQKVREMEEKYDRQFTIVFSLFDDLMQGTDEPERKPIGFTIPKKDLNDSS